MHATQTLPVSGIGTIDWESGPAQTLRLAADYLARHGWIQRCYYDRRDVAHPAACAIGALSIICYGHPNVEPFDKDGDDEDQVEAWHRFIDAEDTLACFLGLHGSDHTDPENVHDWNDDKHRSAADVIATLRAAADDYERHGGVQ